jgi:hypothetical protein
MKEEFKTIFIEKYMIPVYGIKHAKYSYAVELMRWIDGSSDSIMFKNFIDLLSMDIFDINMHSELFVTEKTFQIRTHSRFTDCTIVKTYNIYSDGTIELSITKTTTERVNFDNIDQLKEYSKEN